MNFQAVKNAVEYIQELGVKNVNYLLTTNGTVMTDEMIDYLAKNNFSLSFSLDGDDVNHNRNRVTVSGKETHSIVLQNLRKYSNKLTEYELDIPINLMCCFDDYTDMIKATDFFICLKKEIPQINVMYNRIYQIDTTYYQECENNYLENGSEMNYAESVAKLFDKYYLSEDEKHESIPAAIKSIFLSYYMLKNRKKGMMSFYQGNACMIGDKMCVEPNGEIYICEKANQELSIGNIRSGINHERVHEILEEYYKIRKEYCSKCPIVRMCDVCYVHLIKNKVCNN